MRLSLFDRLRRRQATYQAVFASTPEGKRVLAELCRKAGLDRDVFVPGDPYQTAYQAGARRLVLHILNSLHMSEAEMLRLMKDLEDDDVS